MSHGTGNGAASLLDSYKLEPSGYAEFRRSLIRRLAIADFLVVGGIALLFWRFDRTWADLSGFLVALVTTFWVAYRQLKEQRRNWSSLEFYFRDGKLARNLDKYPVMEFTPNEVTAITESPKGLTVKTNSRIRTMFISRSLSNYDSFRHRLASWAPATPISGRARSPWDYLLYALELLACAWVFGGPLCLLWTSRREVIIPLGIALLLSMLAMILYVRNSPSIPISSQKRLWFLLLLPALGMLVHFF
jgi:hypothetical protein